MAIRRIHIPMATRAGKECRGRRLGSLSWIMMVVGRPGRGGKIVRYPRPRPRAHADVAGPTTIPASTSNKSTTYFENPLVRKFGLFFVPQKIFHLVYSQCFTMYRCNVAVN